VKMTLGQSAETVQVQASAILMQTENATVGTVIDSQKVAELPLNGRSFVQLALLTPGVNPGTPGSITVRRLRGAVGQAVGMSANGARDTQNRFYYDGIEAMDLDSYSFSFSPSIDAINEFKVQSSTYSSEVGGSPGGQVNLSTKSGTNVLHGTLWEFNRNDAFTALNGFQPRFPGVKPPRLNRNQFGANIGGPVTVPKLYHGKDKTFFFFNWESGRQSVGSGAECRRAVVARIPRHTGDADQVADVVLRLVCSAEELVFEETMESGADFIDHRGSENVQFGKADVLRASAVAACVEPERGGRIVGLSVIDVTAGESVARRQGMVDTRDVLILIDGRAGARTAIVDAGLVGIGSGHEAVEKLAGVRRDSAGWDDVSGKLRAG